MKTGKGEMDGGWNGRDKGRDRDDAQLNEARHQDEEIEAETFALLPSLLPPLPGLP